MRAPKSHKCNTVTDVVFWAIAQFACFRASIENNKDISRLIRNVVCDVTAYSCFMRYYAFTKKRVKNKYYLKLIFNMSHMCIIVTNILDKNRESTMAHPI